MILTQETRDLVTSGNLAREAFKVAMNRQAFETLSSGIYSDRVKAVVRELCTNAADSHTATGKGTTPFSVHLPNAMEPWFSVKDWGTGMPEDVVRDLYTTYFASDRRGSDDFTGGFGLGSKSPFAYADSFTVVSRWKGTVTTWAAFWDEGGSPCFAKLGETETDEGDGVEVTVPVGAKDFKAFSEKAADVLTWFDPTPKVVGCPGFSPPKFDYLCRETDWGVLRQRAYNASLLVMGNVAYPLTNIMSHPLVGWGVHLWAPVGSCDIARSREALALTNRTLRAVKELLDRVSKEVLRKGEGELASAPTVWRARGKVKEFRHSFFSNVHSVPHTWRGKDVFSDVRTPPGAKAVYLEEKSKGIHATEYHQFGHTEHPVFLCDTPNDFLARVKGWMRDKGKKKAWVLKDWPDAPLDELGVREVAVLTSALPRLKREKNVPTASGHSRVSQGGYLLFKTGYDPALLGGHWEETDEEPTDDDVVVMCRHGAVYEGGSLGNVPTSSQEFALKVRACAYLNRSVRAFGYRPADEKRARGETTWKEYLDGVLTSRRKDFQLSQDFGSLSYQTHWFNLTPHLGLLPASSPLRVFLEKVREAGDVYQDHALRTALERVFPKGPHESSLEKEAQKIFEEYPLLTLNHWPLEGKVSWEDFVRYAALVDKDKGRE